MTSAVNRQRRPWSSKVGITDVTTLLRIEPSELLFQVELAKEIPCRLKLQNLTDRPVAFQVIMAKNPDNYSIRPAMGIVLPGSTRDVIVAMQVQFIYKKWEDELVVQSFPCSLSLRELEITPDKFTQDSGDYKIEKITVTTTCVNVVAKQIITAIKKRLEDELRSMRIKPFQATELLYITEEYKKMVGKGGYSKVYRGTLPDGKTEVAVKVLNFHDDLENRFVDELSIASLVEHENVVKILGYCLEDDDAPKLVYEFVSAGSLSNLLHQKKGCKLFFEERLKIACESAQGLAHIHTCQNGKIMHGDIKSGNMLLDENLRPKIADFGSSMILSSLDNRVDMKNRGTVGYIDPAYIETNRLSQKSDVFSFGVVLLELFTRKKAIDEEKPDEKGLARSFRSAYEAKTHDLMFDHKGLSVAEEKQFLQDVSDIAFRCVNPKADERPEMKMVWEELVEISRKRSKEREAHIKAIKAKLGKGQERNIGIREFTEDQLKKITSNYSKKIGEGGASYVYWGALDGKDGDDKKEIAVKVSKVYKDMEKDYITELRIPSQMKHKNVIKLVGYCLEGDDAPPQLVYEFISGGTLYKRLHGQDNWPLSFAERLDIATKCAEGFAYIQTSAEECMLHGDIKSLNILLQGECEEDLEPKIADFGFARLLPAEQSSYTVSKVKGTTGYIPPEYEMYLRFGPKGDVYSFGVVLLELLTGKKPVDGRGRTLAEDFRLAYKSRNHRAMFDSEIASDKEMEFVEEFAWLALKCVSPEYEKRPQMKMLSVELLQLRERRCTKLGGGGSSVADEGDDLSPEMAFRTKFAQEVSARFMNNFTRSQLDRMTGMYSRKLGEGGFSTVYWGKLEDGQEVAVKLPRRFGESDHKSFMNEVNIHLDVRHRNVERLLGYCLDGNVGILVFEYIANGNLDHMLFERDEERLPLDTRLQIAAQTARGLAYLHSSLDVGSVLHADINPNNILLDADCTPKISGFGLSRLLISPEETVSQETYTMNLFGTIAYMDPSLMMEGHLTPKNDVYSLGVVLVQLITRKPADPYHHLHSTFTNAFQSPTKGRELLDAEISEGDADIVEKFAELAVECLRMDQHERPDMEEVAFRLQGLLRQHQKRQEERDDEE